ncbi:MAG: hypothetical protein KA419_07845 [Acidobacteria bacterium]|nr:hypothetical protein [Acidobacteriota bacterium]
MGPPQPPFKRVPPPPEKLEAWQEGDVIRVRCVLPAENLDGSPIHDIRVVEIYGGIVPEGVHPLDTVGWGGVIETEEGDRLKALLKGKEFAVEIGREKLGDFETGRAGFSVRFANERNHWSVNTPVLILPVARVGGSPGALSARVEKTGVVLEWKPPAGTVPRDGYVVRRRELPGGAAADVGTVGPDATDFRDADLRFETRYAYSVAPFRNTGGGRVLGAFTPPTDVDTKDTFPPDVPTGLSLVEEEGRLRLIWNPVADADLAGYLVYRAGGDSSGETCLTPKPLAAASFTDTDADPARRWAYRVVAVDRKGNRSTPSETAQWEGRPEDR